METGGGRQSYWEMVSGIVALVVGALALCVTVYTAYLQRKQARAAVWPRVEVALSGSASSFEISLVNKGVGPARIRDFTLALDGRPLATWPDLVRAVVGGESPGSLSMFQPRRTLTPGESALVFSVSGDGLGEAFVRAIPRITRSVCYCSIFDECWLTTRYDEEPSQVDECPARGKGSFIGVDLQHLPTMGGAVDAAPGDVGADAGSAPTRERDR